MEPSSVIEVPGKCYGVPIVKDMIVLGGKVKVYFLSMTGSLKNKIIVGGRHLYSLKVNKANMIFCCDPDGIRLSEHYQQSLLNGNNVNEGYELEWKL